MSNFEPTDKLVKKVNIYVRIKDGQIRSYDGGEIPEIYDGTIAKLIVPAYAFKDKRQLNELCEEKKVLLLNKGTRLLVQIAVLRINTLDKHFLTYFESIRKTFDPLKDIRGLTDAEFIEIELLEDLILTLRGTKKAILNRCGCRIPILDNLIAYSLNHAYTLISQEFEKHRISHSGNVFKDIYYHNDDYKWEPIGNLRDALES